MEYYELYHAVKADYAELQAMHHNQKVTIERLVEEKERFQAEVMKLVITLEELADEWEKT
jgi:hypothetical protein